MGGDAVRTGYVDLGVAGYYAAHAADYRNPHEAGVRAALAAGVEAWSPDLTDVLDLACGSGEATLALLEHGAAALHGVDPFTGAAFGARTGLVAEEASFADVAGGVLAGRRFTLVVCSYALHLCEPSWLPAVALALAGVADDLWLLTPHKKPELREAWGWRMDAELLVGRTRIRRHLVVR